MGHAGCGGELTALPAPEAAVLSAASRVSVSCPGDLREGRAACTPACARCLFPQGSLLAGTEVLRVQVVCVHARGGGSLPFALTVCLTCALSQ